MDKQQPTNEAADGRPALPAALERLWNEQADEFNQWEALGLDEKLEFAAEAERDACAGICDRFAVRGMHPAECAGAIRMRSNG